MAGTIGAQKVCWQNWVPIEAHCLPKSSLTAFLLPASHPGTGRLLTGCWCGSPLLQGPQRRPSCALVVAPGTSPPQPMEKLGWSLRKHSICFANCCFCLRAGPVNSVSLRALCGWGPLATVPSSQLWQIWRMVKQKSWLLGFSTLWVWRALVCSFSSNHPAGPAGPVFSLEPEAGLPFPGCWRLEGRGHRWIREWLWGEAPSGPGARPTKQRCDSWDRLSWWAVWGSWASGGCMNHPACSLTHWATLEKPACASSLSLSSLVSNVWISHQYRIRGQKEQEWILPGIKENCVVKQSSLDSSLRSSGNPGQPEEWGMKRGNPAWRQVQHLVGRGSWDAAWSPILLEARNSK